MIKVVITRVIEVEFDTDISKERLQELLDYESDSDLVSPCEFRDPIDADDYTPFHINRINVNFREVE